jgi:hypothetical protein
MEKDILKKDVTKLSTKDKILFALIIALFIAVIVVGIILINKKNDKDTLNKIEKNKNNSVETWKTTEEVVKFEEEKTADHYEYCVSLTEDNKECLWSRTETPSLTIDTNGHKYVYFKLVDKNGKVTKEDVKEVFIDSSNPIINEIQVLEEEKVTIRVEAVDNVSSIAKYYYSLDGENYTEGTMTYVYKDLSKTGSYTVYVKVEDKAGNTATDSIQIVDGVKQIFTKEETKPETPVVEENNTETQPEEAPNADVIPTE